jgi:hypothetical protein
MTDVNNDSQTLTREEAEATFHKVEGLLKELMITAAEILGDDFRGCSGTNRFVHHLQEAATNTRRDIRACGGVLLNAIPVLTMYLLGVEGGFVEHPHPRWSRTRRAQEIVYAPDLPSASEGPAAR